MVLLELNLKISQYIKDIANLLTHNQWTCGDYQGNLDGFTFRTTNQHDISLDKSYATNGDCNIKLQRTIDSQGYSFIIINYQIKPEDYGKTLTIIADINNNLNGNGILQISSSTATRVYIPTMTTGTFSVSRLIEEDGLQMQITSSAIGEIYVDNLRAIIL